MWADINLTWHSADWTRTNVLFPSIYLSTKESIIGRKIIKVTIRQLTGGFIFSSVKKGGLFSPTISLPPTIVDKWIDSIIWNKNLFCHRRYDWKLSTRLAIWSPLSSFLTSPKISPLCHPMRHMLFIRHFGCLGFFLSSFFKNPPIQNKNNLDVCLESWEEWKYFHFFILNQTLASDSN